MQSLINRRRTYYHYNEFRRNWFRLIPEGDNATITCCIDAIVPTSSFEYIEYSTDAGKTWVRTNNVDNTDVYVTVSNVRREHAVCFRGKGTAASFYTNNNTYFTDFKCNVTYRAAGDVKSLLYLDDFAGKSVPDRGLCGLFYNETNLRSAADLELSATSLGDYAYAWMFGNCSRLTTAPTVFPSVTGMHCFFKMFMNCTSLVTPPSALLGSMSYFCCESMFEGCTSLTSTPGLPATTLAEGCYYRMFSGCTALTSTTTLPATKAANRCYEYMFSECTALTTAPTLPATTLGSKCYYSMFRGCTSLSTAPTLPATTLKASCYQDMFNGCTALVTAPVLKAKTLVDSCYNGMFVNCSSLNYIKALFTTTPSTSYTWNWVINVAATGIFIKNPNANWDVTGDNGVPTGWNEAVEVEYLQSTGTQYINTGITNTLDTELYVDFQLTGGTSEDRKIIGQGFKFGFGQYESKWRIVDDAWYKTSVSTDTSRHIFRTNDGKYYLDSTLLADRYSHKAAGTYPMLLFAVSSQNSASPDGNCAKMKLYGCKIYEGNSLVRDFVPVSMENVYGEPIGYMYDKVSCSVFSNAGSGYFTIGPTV